MSLWHKSYLYKILLKFLSLLHCLRKFQMHNFFFLQYFSWIAAQIQVVSLPRIKPLSIKALYSLLLKNFLLTLFSLLLGKKKIWPTFTSWSYIVTHTKNCGNLHKNKLHRKSYKLVGFYGEIYLSLHIYTHNTYIYIMSNKTNTHKYPFSL